MAKILVVEDDPPMNNILVGTLTDDEHQVVSAMDGAEAGRHFREGGFDLVISDVRLPGIDGIETLSHLKKLDPKILTIIMTGYASSDTPVRAMRLKVDDYLMKPFSLRYFLTSVNRVLDTDGSKKAKSALVQSLFHMFGTVSTSSRLDVLTQERKEAFRALYIGTRSGYLSRRTASELYIHLETLEERYRNVLNIEDPGEERVAALATAYQSLIANIESLTFGSGEDETEELPRDQLTDLFQAIKASDVGLDDVQYAPLLRKTPDETFQRAPKLQALKDQLWPKLGSQKFDLSP